MICGPLSLLECSSSPLKRATACRFACSWSCRPSDLSPWRGRLGARLELLLAETLRIACQAALTPNLPLAGR
jgi:hypothetical protein